MILERLRLKLKRNPDAFLKNASGVIHVGANTGQERNVYASLGLPVVWIEPIPEVFCELEANVEAFPDQRAIQALVTDRDGEEYPFHVANNSGASSSILDFKAHRDIWPEVNFTKTIVLKSVTLPTLLEQHNIETSRFNTLIIDTQGSELLVVKGAIPLLGNFRFIKTEVSDFESYAGGCQLGDFDSFMTEHGLQEYSRNKFASRPGGGSYFDIVYEKKIS